jgi:Pyruvate/2-oxoacid:ferredoxin oxidoreductase delta subunit
MEGNGPASPDLRNIGLILASDNAVAIDGVIATMMGIDEPGQLRFLKLAKEAGLGDYDLKTIEVIGELKRLPAFKLPPLSGEALVNNETLNTFLHSKTIMRPHADPALCTGCGSCVAQCPTSALSMDDHLPQVDTDKCIACFCCQEVCPEKAITLK